MRKQNGVTLIELMVTISIAAILLAIATPSISSFMRASRVQSATSEVAAALALARSEAIKRGTTVSLCSPSGGACSATTDWSDGIAVIGAALIKGVSIDPNVTVTSSVNKVDYSSTGTAMAATITLTSGDCPNRTARLINVAASGRTQVSTQECP